MASYKMFVLSNPAEGEDERYNDWYSNQHLQEVTAVPGIRQAQRFKLANNLGFEHKWQYVALYELETDDLDATIADLMGRQGSGQMYVSDALDLDSAIAGVFAPCSPVVSGD